MLEEVQPAFRTHKRNVKQLSSNINSYKGGGPLAAGRPVALPQPRQQAEAPLGTLARLGGLLHYGGLGVLRNFLLLLRDLFRHRLYDRHHIF